MRRLWQRHFLKECLCTLILILFCFFSLYILIDYSLRSHSREMTSLFFHYTVEFLRRLDVILPFALLFSTIRTLHKLNHQRELIALLGSGVSLRKLIAPFIWIGLLCTALQFANVQFTLPLSLKTSRIATASAKSTKKKKYIQPGYIHSLKLKDHSTLLYPSYDPTTLTFQNAYWIKNHDEFYFIENLDASQTPPVGNRGERLLKTTEHTFSRTRFEKPYQFAQMKFHKNVLFNSFSPPEEMRFSKLWRTLPPHSPPFTGKEAHIRSVFFERMMAPWLSLIAVLLPISWALRFSRTPNPLLTYTFGLLTLLFCYLLLHALGYLVKKQVFDHFWAACIPFLLLIGWHVKKFLRKDYGPS